MIMWSPSNERFLDRRGCGDEFFLDADLKASSWLAGVNGGELAAAHDVFDDYEADDAAAH
jgi:hypothetical protein